MQYSANFNAFNMSACSGGTSNSIRYSYTARSVYHRRTIQSTLNPNYLHETEMHIYAQMVLGAN